jgi:hypothetical protein
VRLAQGLVVTQAPLGQVAPAGQASTGSQAQVLGLAPAATSKVTPLGLPLHASAVA